MMNITSLKNKYQGKRIFIVGNGDSLNRTNLDLLKNEFSFGMNRISKIFSKTNWRPNFFLCTTENINKKEWHEDIIHGIQSSSVSFLWEELEHFINEESSNIVKIKCNNGSEVTNNAPNSWWSIDPKRGFSKFGTSMLVAIQLSVYMGFKDIYIIGADLGFKNNFLQRIFYRLGLRNIIKDKNHFSKDYGTPGFDAKTLNANMIAAHLLAKKETEKLDVKIKNATIGGELEVYPRCNFKDLF